MWGDHNWHQRPVGSLEVVFNIWVAPKEASGDWPSHLGTGPLGLWGAGAAGLEFLPAVQRPSLSSPHFGESLPGSRLTGFSLQTTHKGKLRIQPRGELAHIWPSGPVRKGVLFLQLFLPPLRWEMPQGGRTGPSQACELRLPFSFVNPDQRQNLSEPQFPPVDHEHGDKPACFPGPLRGL